MITHVKSVDPRAKRTHQLLQQALLELLRERSFASITVQDIAERATVNRATFYAHFQDKYHLLDSVIREQFQRKVASTLPTASRGGVSSLRVLIEAVFDYLTEVQSEWKPTATQFEPLFEQIVQEELSLVLSSRLKQVPASGRGQRVPVGTMALVMSWAIFGAAAQWSRGERTISAEQMVNNVLTVITEGIAHLAPAKSNQTDH